MRSAIHVLDKWITFETTHNGSQFVFHRGRWYNIGNVYLDMLQSRLERVFAASSGLTFPSWPKELNDRGESRPIHERRYNQNAAEIDGFTLLDRKFLYTEQHPGGFEACDLFGPNEDLVHVKRLDDSVSASHLFNQALISFESLQSQQDAREEL